MNLVPRVVRQACLPSSRSMHLQAPHRCYSSVQARWTTGGQRPWAKPSLQRTISSAMTVQGFRHYSTPVSTEVTSVGTNVIEQVTSIASGDGMAQAAAQIGDFKALGLCHFTPVGGLEATLEAMHVLSGLPWWGTIVATTLLVRTLLLPLVIRIQHNNERLKEVNPEVTRIMDNLKKANAKGDVVATGRYTEELRDLFSKNKCHPMKSLGLPLIQMPVMASFFLALKAMAEVQVPGLQEGGLWWFTDMASKDPYYALPVISAAGMMVVLEAGMTMAATNNQSKVMKNVFRGLTVVMVPFTAWLPSSVFIYWITSNGFSIGQILAFRNPAVRKFLGFSALK